MVDTCSITGCDSSANNKGMCWAHYMRVRRTGRAEGIRGDLRKHVVAKTICGHADRKHYAHGLCESCYVTKRAKETESHKKWRLENREKDNAYALAWRNKTIARNPDHFRNKELIRKYRITLDEYSAMLEAQKNRCANSRCTFVMEVGTRGRGKVLVVDHDHVTGKVRGLLCGACNRAAGHAKEDIKRLVGLVEYLERYR